MAGGWFIVIVNCLVWFPAIFVAWAEKVNWPAAVGVPEIRPDWFKVRPGGSWPEAMAHVIGVVPVADSCWR